MKKQILLVGGILSIFVGVMAMEKERVGVASGECVLMVPYAQRATQHGTVPRTAIVTLGNRKKQGGARRASHGERPKVTVVEIGDSDAAQAVAWKALKGQFVKANLAFHSGGNLEKKEAEK